MIRRMIAAALLVVLLVAVGFWIQPWMFESADDQRVTRDRVASSPKPLPPTEPEEPAVLVMDVSGRVERARGDGPRTLVHEGDHLTLDDTVHTHAESRAVLDLGGIGTVEVAEQSDVTVAEISDSLSRMLLGEGRISAMAHGKGNGRLRVEVRGTDAAAEATRGRFAVLAGGAGEVAVATQEGSVRLSARSKSVEVAAGQHSMVRPQRAPTQPEPIPPSLYLKLRSPDAVAQRSRRTTVRGRTTPGAVVRVNGVRAETGEGGDFAATVPLEEGRNDLVVAVHDATGRRLERKLPPITVDTRPPEVRGEVAW